MRRAPLTPEELSRLVELLPTAPSLRAIAREMGKDPHTIRTVAEPLIAIMRATDALPPCDCGRERFHRYSCTASNKRRRPYNRPLKDRAVSQTPLSLLLRAKRVAIIEALIAGKRFSEIDREMGFRNNNAHTYLVHLTPDQLAERNRNLLARGLPPMRPSQSEEAQP